MWSQRPAVKTYLEACIEHNRPCMLHKTKSGWKLLFPVATMGTLFLFKMPNSITGVCLLFYLKTNFQYLLCSTKFTCKYLIEDFCSATTSEDYCVQVPVIEKCVLQAPDGHTKSVIWTLRPWKVFGTSLFTKLFFLRTLTYEVRIWIFAVVFWSRND